MSNINRCWRTPRRPHPQAGPAAYRMSRLGLSQGGRSNGGALLVPASGRRDHRDRPARLRRGRLRAGHPLARGRDQGAFLGRRPRLHLVRLRPDRRRDDLHDRQGLGLPHQPGRDLRARGDEAIPLARGADVLVEPDNRRRPRRVCDLGLVRRSGEGSRLRLRGGELRPRGDELGLGDVHRGPRYSHPHVHRARDRRQSIAGGLGRPRDRPRRRGDHHHRRPRHERVDQPGAPARPALRADDRRVAHPQLAQGVRRLHPGEPDRSGAGGVRLRPDRHTAEDRAADQGGRDRAGPGRDVRAGDVMYFKLAAELAEDEDIQVESVLTNDVAIEDSLYTAGRRGVGVTVLVEKIAGAKAEAGGSLAEVAAVARKVNDQGRSFGVALTSCATPAAGSPTFEIGADEMEVGVGIHGEPGRRREKVRPAADVVAEMSEAILSDLDPSPGTPLLAFVNGLGGTPLIELYVVYNELAKQLGERGLEATRSLVGNYITSLEMAGVSITLLALDGELTALWDAPVHTPALRWVV